MSCRKFVPFAALLLTAVSGAAWAGDAADVARETRMPVPVVDNVLTNVDAFFASPQAPSNRLTSGIFKQLALKAVRDRMGGLDDALPGKSSDAGDDENNATYHASVRTTRHDASETQECVENTVLLTGSEGVPAVKDGAFVFDTVHPRQTAWSWTLTFCRAVAAGGAKSDWQLAAK